MPSWEAGFLPLISHWLTSPSSLPSSGLTFHFPLPFTNTVPTSSSLGQEKLTAHGNVRSFYSSFFFSSDLITSVNVLSSAVILPADALLASKAAGPPVVQSPPVMVSTIPFSQTIWG